MPVVTCPCGRLHELSHALSALYDHPKATADSVIVVATRTGKYEVPKLYLACHSLTPDLPGEAARLGFRRV